MAAGRSCVGNSDNLPGAIVAERKAIAAAQRAQVHDVQARVPYHSVVRAVSQSKRPPGDLGEVLSYRIEVDGIRLRTRSTEGKVGIATTTPADKLDVNGAINTTDRYRIGNSTVLGIGNSADDNLFVGVRAGANNEPGQGVSNVFLGFDAGTSNSTGGYNVFSGAGAGENNAIGGQNIFIGFLAGSGNTSGDDNTYIGTSAGEFDGDSGNTFVGFVAGLNNSSGNNDIYVGNLGCNYLANGHSSMG